jgi:assimilatory nitrate reductase catalytic subunit
LLATFGLDVQGVMRYADTRRAQQRCLRLDSQGRLQAFLLAGEARAQAWVLNALQQGAPAATLARALLADAQQPPAGVAPRSPQVCACHDVSQTRIIETLACCAGDEPQRLAQLQQQLACGTGCGSCLPALKALARAHPARAPRDPVHDPAHVNVLAHAHAHAQPR